MPEYTFEQLSPLDFEILSRDLLQEELGLTLESFGPGRDRGIDFRAWGSGGTIVQCKHLRRSGFPALVRAMRTEREKLDNLQPARYILTTSVSLSPDRKEQLLALLAPYSLSPTDIIGSEDLNNLLGLHQAIERAHVKLWMSSIAVLERVLHAQIFAESAATLDAIRARMSKFVVTPAFKRATDVLKQQKLCVIAGVPGIGKTTLAEMILLGLVDRGFECHRVWNDVGEAVAVYNATRRQIFYYDDFLGRTGLRSPLTKNEDARLLQFINTTSRSQNSYLLLTTREYILNQARFMHEALQDQRFDVASCIITLKDYTQRVRAEILYNHLYFSDLPRPYVENIVQSGAYHRIVGHRNYSPRLIEAMTSAVNVREVSPRDYSLAFGRNLDNPQRLWRTAFENHLSLGAQHALLVLASLPDAVRYGELRTAFEAFHQLRCRDFAHGFSPYDFERALKELEGTFSKTESDWLGIVVSFANPSVRDFLESQLRQQPSDLVDILGASEFREQPIRVWDIIKGQDELVCDEALVDRVVECLMRRASSPGSNARSEFGAKGSTWQRAAHSPLPSIAVAIDIAKDSEPDLRDRRYATILDVLALLIDQLDLTPVDSIDLFAALESIRWVSNPQLLTNLRESVLDRVIRQFQGWTHDAESLLALHSFGLRHQRLVPGELLDALTEQAADLLDTELDRLKAEDPGEAVGELVALEELASQFSIGLDRRADDIREMAYSEPEDWESYRPSTTSSEHSNFISRSELQSMFESLLELPGRR